MKYSSPNILDGSVTTAKLADDSVTEPKILNLAVTRPKIDGGAVDGTKLAINAVGQSRLASGAVSQAKIETSETSLSGQLLAGVTLDIALDAYTLFPMFHTDEQDISNLTVHSVDGAGADNPRLALVNTGAPAFNYDVDYRSINA